MRFKAIPSSLLDIGLILVAATLAACFSDTRFSTARFAVSGKPQDLNFICSLNPDCTVKGFATVRVSSAPEHGQVTIVQGPGYSTFPASSQHYACNLKPTQGIVVTYVSNPGFTGSDSLTIEAIYPGGRAKTSEYTITVK